MERNKINKLEGALESSIVKGESNKGSSGIISSLLDVFMPLGYTLVKGLIGTMAFTDLSNEIGFDIIKADLPYSANWIIGIYGYASAALEAVRFVVIDSYVINNIGPDKHYKSVGGYLPWEIISAFKIYKLNKTKKEKED